MTRLHELPDGARLAYDDIGKGRPVVLLHGVCMSRRFFERNTGPLAERFRVVNVDLRGHGESPASEGGHTVAQRWHACADAGVGPVPTEQLAELPTNCPQRSAGKRTAGRVTRREALNEPMEVARAAGRRKRPHVLEAKIVRELVDSPWPRGLRAVRESHR